MSKNSAVYRYEDIAVSGKPVKAKIKRECLRCGREFIAPNKWIRLCNQCKQQIKKDN